MLEKDLQVMLSKNLGMKGIYYTSHFIKCDSFSGYGNI